MLMITAKKVFLKILFRTKRGRPTAWAANAVLMKTGKPNYWLLFCSASVTSQLREVVAAGSTLPGQLAGQEVSNGSALRSLSAGC